MEFRNCVYSRNITFVEPPTSSQTFIHPESLVKKSQLLDQFIERI